MQRYKILHHTRYDFSSSVQLNPHSLRLRPREGHELIVESSSLEINPPATLRWHRDAEDNSVAIANFTTPTNQLSIESMVIIQQFNQEPLDFLLAEYATDFPFTYTPEDLDLLAPYMTSKDNKTKSPLNEWVTDLCPSGEQIQTYAVLQRLCNQIKQEMNYQIREEPGVQTAEETLSSQTGSCRDFANLFLEAARHLGFAARFVSGYLYVPQLVDDFGATHAWAEAYLPGAGWKGFDPTIGNIVGTDHIAVAVSKWPESVPPVAGSFIGPPGASLDVKVWVTKLK